MAPPRWAPDLPLPAEPYTPGAAPPGPALTPAALSQTVPPRPALPIGQALAADGVTLTGITASAFSPALFGYGADLFNTRCFWEAHECWEVLWRREPRGHPRRALLQGLILLAAARVKLRQGRPQGAEALQRRALVQLQRAHDAPAHLGAAQLGIDIPRLLAAARAAGLTGTVTLAPTLPPAAHP